MTRLPAEPPDRFGTREAVARLNAILCFDHDPFMQDWEIERSDGARLSEFIAAYTNLTLSDDDQFTLMGLIVASADDALKFHDLADEQWQTIKKLLVAKSWLHSSTIYDWCCADAICYDECFTLTSYMREVWNISFPNGHPFPSVPESGSSGTTPADPATDG